MHVVGITEAHTAKIRIATPATQYKPRKGIAINGVKKATTARKKCQFRSIPDDSWFWKSSELSDSFDSLELTVMNAAYHY
jgi:hypothetical protein